MQPILNPAQLEAVRTLKGPLLVLAGAGTGKTRVVTYRIAELIRTGTRPERILAVTFTNKAAEEMQQRSAALLGKQAAARKRALLGKQAVAHQTRERPEISTFHSLCVRILRRHIRHLGFPERFAIYDRGDQEGVARSVLREIRAADAALRPGELLYFISRWKNSGIRAEQAANLAQTDKEHLAAAAYRRYQNALRAAGALDFDDLLLATEELFSAHPKIRRAEADRFDHLLVDEYQDTNGCQYRIVKALAEGHRNICVVGDDDQSIYGWRGADLTHILRFKNDWPDAKVVRLETNYRSTREIVDWANRLIAFNKLRHDKRLRARTGGEAPRIKQLQDEAEEAKWVVDEIAARLDANGCRPRDFAILCRTNEQPRTFEAELRRARIPYVLLGGMSFYDRREVRDVLAYLKLLVNPADEIALLRTINTPPRGIGQAAVRRLLDEAIGRGKPIWNVLNDQAELHRIVPVAAQAIGSFRELIEGYHKQAITAGQAGRGAMQNTVRKHGRGAHRPLVDLVSRFLRDIGYKEALMRQYADAAEQESRWASVEELVNALGLYEQRSEAATLAGFLQETALMGEETDRDRESQLERNAVALMTLHAAKGLEFGEVYMVGMEEGLLPHHRSVSAAGGAVDEERRLCYVGVTRARRRLTLTMALKRNKWGKPRPTTPSRFLYEITGQTDNPNYLAIHGKNSVRRTEAPQKRPCAGTRE